MHEITASSYPDWLPAGKGRGNVQTAKICHTCYRFPPLEVRVYATGLHQFFLVYTFGLHLQCA
jgi:hypothetical protein